MSEKPVTVAVPRAFLWWLAGVFLGASWAAAISLTAIGYREAGGIVFVVAVLAATWHLVAAMRWLSARPG